MLYALLKKCKHTQYSYYIFTCTHTLFNIFTYMYVEIIICICILNIIKYFLKIFCFCRLQIMHTIHLKIVIERLQLNFR